MNNIYFKSYTSIPSFINHTLIELTNLPKETKIKIKFKKS
jgi:hypothetical protein